MNDQNAKHDEGKPMLSLVPTGIDYAIEKVRRYGCEKYPEGGKDNWRQVDIQRHWEAVLRHTTAARENLFKIDPESGLPHVYHAACDLAFVIEMMGNTAFTITEDGKIV